MGVENMEKLFPLKRLQNIENRSTIKIKVFYFVYAGSYTMIANDPIFNSEQLDYELNISITR